MTSIPGNYIECPACHRYNHPSANCKCGQPKGKSKDEPSLEQVFDSAIDVSSERELQNDSFAWLSQNGAVAIIWHAMNKPTTCFSGVSDFVFGWPTGGRLVFCAIEIKIGKNKPTPSQQAYLDAVKSAGGISAVCRSVEEIRSILRAI